MKKITWHQAIRNAWALYCNRSRIAYFYGAKGQLLTDENMNALIAAEPEYFKKYTKEEIEQIKRNSRNKTGYDCSGFVAACNMDRQYSTGQSYNGKRSKDIKAGKAGSMLYKETGGRHAGIDVGYGMYMDCGTESTDYAVKAGIDSIRLRPICSYNWEWTTESDTVDYTGGNNY